VRDEKRGCREKEKGKWMRKMMMKAMMLILMRISAGVVARAEQVSPWTDRPFRRISHRFAPLHNTNLVQNNNIVRGRRHRPQTPVARHRPCSRKQIQDGTLHGKSDALNAFSLFEVSSKARNSAIHDVAVLPSGHIYCMDLRIFVGYLLLIMTKSDSQTGFRRTVRRK
jgi:hypothetical protein